MKEKKLNVSGIFLRDCISKLNYIRRNHLEAHKYTQIEHLQNVADTYFAHFLSGELNIKTTDTETFADYIDTFGLEKRDELLDKLQTQISYDVREYLSKPKEQTWWTRLWNTPKKEKTTTCFSLWQRTKNKLKYIILAVMVAMGGIFGLKNDSNAMENRQSQKSSININKLPNFQRFSMPKPTDYTLSTFIKKAQLEVKKDTVIQESKAYTNFYNHRLAQFIGTEKRDKMLADMEKQIKDGKITLPADISASHYLYATEIYRRYGYFSIEKTLNDVLKSSKTIPPKVQNSLFRYVRLAGKKGVGVQQMRHGKQIKTQAVRT